MLWAALRSLQQLLPQAVVLVVALLAAAAAVEVEVLTAVTWRP